MSFKDVMERVGRSMADVKGVIVIGDDGIIVERLLLDPAYDSELASVEYMGGYKGIEKATKALEAGSIEEITVVADQTRMLLRELSPGYFLMIILGPEGSLGRGRYELKKAAYDLAPEFL